MKSRNGKAAAVVDTRSGSGTPSRPQSAQRSVAGSSSSPASLARFGAWGPRVEAMRPISPCSPVA